MPVHYTAFTASDFIADAWFQQWVLNPDPGSNAFWTQWLEQNPDKKETVQEAVHFIKSLHFREDLPAHTQTEFALRESLRKIDELEREPTSMGQTWLLPVVAAAAAAIVVIAGIFLLGEKQLSVEVVTGMQEKRTVLLPDSSTVILNAQSNIRYKSNMKTAREVWLEGEGYFQVQHRENAEGKPQNFIVHSGDLDIEVLGTEFNVKKGAGTTNVSLNSGSIRIGIKGREATTVTMQPGDFVQYKSVERKMVKKQVRPDLYSVWKEERLELEDVPLHEFAQLVQDTYGYQVVFEDSRIRDEKISGSLHLKSESDLLEAIAFTLDISITKKDKVLYFESKRKNNK